MTPKEHVNSLVAISTQLEQIQENLKTRHESIVKLRKKTERLIYNGTKYRGLLIAPEDAFDNVHPASPFGDFEEFEEFLVGQIPRLSELETIKLPASMFDIATTCEEIKEKVIQGVKDKGFFTYQPQILMPVGIILSCVFTETPIKSQRDFLELTRKSREETVTTSLLDYRHRVFPMIHPEVLHWSRNGAIDLFYETLTAINRMPRLELD